jgi:hypothetical protein
MRMPNKLKDLLRPAARALRKRGAKLDRIQWLATTCGPRHAAILRSFEPRPLARLVIRLDAALRRRPVPPRRIYLPSPPIAKVHAVRWHARHFGLRTFVETGTYHGDTTAAVADLFDRCVTIELSQHLHEAARARFAAIDKIECLRGDSAVLVREVVKNLSGPALFWLDAHHSGGVTADSGHDPIRAELSAILGEDQRGHVVLIDDARGHAIDVIRAAAPRHVLTVRNDIIRLLPAAGRNALLRAGAERAGS